MPSAATRPQKAIGSVNAGQKALDQAKADLAKVSGPGIDLIADDPSQALRLLTDAAQQLDTAEAAKVSGSVVSPLRAQAVAGLDRLYGVVPVASTPVFTFKTAAGAAPVNLTALVRGPDGNPYVLDQTNKAVYRIGLKTPAATLVAKNGTKTKFGTVATPRFLAAAGQDLLILDSKNALWRWRPADDTGKGTLTKVILNGSAALGNDIVNMNAWLKPGTQGLYNLYIVDPSEQQIRSYAPAADGSGFPAPNPAPWLAVTKDVSQMTSTYVDGDMFVSDGGAIVRYVTGKSEGWDPKAPKDTLLRAAPVYSIVAGGTARRQGNIFGYDKPNARVIALSKTDGSYQAQYRLAGGANGWSDLRGMYIIQGSGDGPSTLVWLSANGVNQSILVAVPDTTQTASPSPSASPVPSPSPAKATPKPTKKR